MNESETLGGPDDFDDAWILNLQELLDTLEPQIRQSNALQILEDFLTSLESTDPNFHRYNFIKQIKEKLQVELTPLINDITKHHNLTPGDDVVPSDISEKLGQSEEFVKASTSILDSVRMAAENITEHLKSNTFDFSDHAFKFDAKDRGHGDESMCSTNDGLDLMFMSPNHYKTLAKDLSPVKSLDTRLKSLTALQQVPQTDLVASDAWNVTRRGLLCALDDENEEVHIQALTFLSHLFISGSSHVVKEYLMILIENLIEYFNDSTSHMVAIETGLDLGDRRNIYLLRKFRLFSQIQEELPSFWLRYSDKYIEDITLYVFSLLQFVPMPISDTIGENLMTPLHFLALVDPLAKWFKYWMHGLYGRSQIIKSLRVHTKFLVKPIDTCINFPSTLENVEVANFSGGDSVGENGDENVYTSCDISYTYFLHSISIISHLMLYEDGANLLCRQLPDGNMVDAKTIVLVLIDIIKLYPNELFNVTKSLYHPVYLIADIFSSFVSNGVATCEQLLCHDDVCDALLEPIQNVQDADEKHVDIAKVNVLADILFEIAGTAAGRTQLIHSKYGSNVTPSPSDTNVPPTAETSPIHVIAKSLCCLLEESSHDSLSTNALSALSSLCSQIYTTCEGVNVLRKFKLSNKLYACINKHKEKLRLLSEKVDDTNDAEQETVTGSLVSFRKMSSEDQVTYKVYVTVVKEMLDDLLIFCLTPRGVQLVDESGGLADCVAYLIDKCQSYEYQESRIDKFALELCMSQLSVTSPGVAALNQSGYVSRLLESCWSHLEGYTNDYMRIVLSDIPEDLTHRKSKKLFVTMAKLLSNFNAVYQLFEPPKPRPEKGVQSSDENSKNNAPQLKNFHDFVTKLVVIESHDKHCLLAHPEQTHLFALNVFSCVVTCLDSMLYLEAKYHFKESMLKMQAICKLEGNSYVIDQCSIKRNQILVMVYLLGGVSERSLPPDTLTQDTSSPYPWPLFSNYPTPDAYTLKVVNPAIGPTKKKSAFETYLSDIEGTDWSKCEKRDEMIEEIRRRFTEEVKAKSLKSSDKIITKLMEVVVDIHHSDSRYNIFSADEKSRTKKMKLSEWEETGVDMVARYGHVVRAVSSVAEASDVITSLLLQWKSHVCDTSSISQLTEYKGFHWFLALTGLMFSHDKNMAWEVMKKFSSLVHSKYLWFSRVTSLNEEQQEGCAIHPIFSNVCHYVELLLQNKLPQVFAAFRHSGYSPSHICYVWFRHCFLNFMDWGDITWYITTCVVMGIDYQVYFTLAVFKHLEENILFHTQNNDLVIFLKTVPLKDFQYSEYLDFMKDLESEYRPIIMEDLMSK